METSDGGKTTQEVDRRAPAHMLACDSERGDKDRGDVVINVCYTDARALAVILSNIRYPPLLFINRLIFSSRKCMMRDRGLS